MKRLLCLFTVLGLAIVPAFAEEEQEVAAQYGQQQMNMQNQGMPSRIHWYTDFNQAMQVAKRENKSILLFFTGSDWCGWCKKMDQEVFSQTEFAKEVGSSFVFVLVDFPMHQQLSPEVAQQNAMLKQKYGVTGYPTIIILDPDGNRVAEAGYQAGGAKAYAEYLKQWVHH